MSTDERLLAKIEAHPHWRILLRPGGVYMPERIATLSKCWDVIEKAKVGLRGWDFPHLSPSDEDRAQRTSYIEAWSDFIGHNEYWRLYQSGQFLYLGEIREFADGDWSAKLRKEMQLHSGGPKGSADAAKGFLSLLNFLYKVTEAYEFAARIAGLGTYSDTVTIEISLHHVAKFMLAADLSRVWSARYMTKEDTLSRTVELTVPALLADSGPLAVDTCIWFFERFGWMNPSRDVLVADQQLFLARNA